ncbi:MAG: NAD(P)/FAD-dependent oxidoreductase [Cyanobacteria bacterium P01_A01_bin.135]
MTQSASPHIVILGGGFAGLYAALKLDGLAWEEKPTIVLADQRDRFLFVPLLYELVTGELETWEIAPLYADLLANTSVQFQKHRVTGVDVDGSMVYFDGAEPQPYDYLVLGLGGETPLDIVPGAAEYAIPFRTVDDAYRLKQTVQDLESSERDRIRVAIVGGGYSGVELACKLADRLGERGRIRIIEMSDKILGSSTDFNQEAADKALEERNVWIDLETKVTQVEADNISLEYREQVDTIPVDVVLWTVGTKVAEVVTHMPLEKNDRQQLLTTPTLQATGHPNIFPLGDIAEIHDASGQRVPVTAQAALQEAQFAAWNIWASATARPLLPFRYEHLGEMMSLGMDSATLTGLGVTLDGPAAHIARRLAYLYRMPTLDHQVKVGLNWVTRPLRDLLAMQ